MPAGPPPRTTTSKAPKSGMLRAGSATWNVLKGDVMCIPLSVQRDPVGLNDGFPSSGVCCEQGLELGWRVSYRVHVLAAEHFPDSWSGKDGERLPEATARARILPALMCGITAAAGNKAMSTSPLSKAVTATPEPR